MAGLFWLCAVVGPAAGASMKDRETTKVFEGEGDTVVVVHGLKWFAIGGMDWMARQFNRVGHRVILVRYPSRKIDCDKIVKEHLARALDEGNTRKQQPLHFVSHSLGAVVTHQLLQDDPPPNLGRCVFLGTPHRGTELADFLARRLRWTLRIIGPAAASLNTSHDNLPAKLRPVEFPVGVILGDRSRYPFLSPFIPGPDDGVVPLRTGLVAGARDTLVLHEAHVEMIRSREVFQQSRHFIETGTFDHSRPPSPPRYLRLGRRPGL